MNAKIMFGKCQLQNRFRHNAEVAMSFSTKPQLPHLFKFKPHIFFF